MSSRILLMIFNLLGWLGVGYSIDTHSVWIGLVALLLVDFTATQQGRASASQQ